MKISNDFEEIYSSDQVTYYYNPKLNLVGFEQKAKDQNNIEFCSDFFMFVLNPPILKLLNNYLEMIGTAESKKMKFSDYISQIDYDYKKKINEDAYKFLLKLQTKGYPKTLTVIDYNETLKDMSFIKEIKRINKASSLCIHENGEVNNIVYLYKINTNGYLTLYEVYGYNSYINGVSDNELISFKTIPLPPDVCIKLIDRFNKMIKK